MKRYEMIEKVRGMESWTELHSDPDGDWVRYEDVAKLEAAAKAVLDAFTMPTELHADEQEALSELRKCLEGK